MRVLEPHPRTCLNTSGAPLGFRWPTRGPSRNQCMRLFAPRKTGDALSDRHNPREFAPLGYNEPKH